jgi:hypothetical protein
MVTTVRYHFRQPFSVPAKEAFDWCTDYGPQDHSMMGYSNSKRAVIKVSEGCILLTDTFQTAAGLVEKQKLVQLYPDKLFWVNTHLIGPNRHSQFLYQISPDQKGGSCLHFTALHLEYESEEDAKTLAERLCQADSAAWKLLAKAMTDELTKSKSR